MNAEDFGMIDCAKEVRIRPCFTRPVVGHPHCERGGKWSDDEGTLEVRRDADGFIEWNDALGVSDAQSLATVVVDPLGKGLEDHWEKTSHALTVGMILHVIYMWQSGRSDYPPSLHRIEQIIRDPSLQLKRLWSEMILGVSNPTHVCSGYYRSGGHPVAISTAQDMMGRPFKECFSIIATTKSFLWRHRNPPPV